MLNWEYSWASGTARRKTSNTDSCRQYSSHSKTGLFLWQPLLFSFFLFFFNVPVTMSEYTPRTLHSSSDGKKLFPVQDGNLWATGCSLFRLPLSGTTFLLTSDTAVLSHSSKPFSKLFPLLLPTLKYSNPFTGTGYFWSWFSANIFIDWCVYGGGGGFLVVVFWFLVWFLFFWGGWVEVERQKKRWKQWVEIVCMCVWGEGQYVMHY